jgi:Putative auto-transporter adhesin, head GIN domain
MKNKILVLLLLCQNCWLLKAQKGPLVGSGKVIINNFEIQEFDRISFEDFDGQIEVEIGKPYSIKVEIDENLKPRLEVLKEEKDKLTIRLKGNYNGKLYLEKTRIKIKVTLPNAIEIQHRGNTNLNIMGIIGNSFRLENDGNGDVKLAGKINELVIKKTGNGEVKAQYLIAKMAKVKSFGNGNVSINSQISLLANGAGNCSVMQFGQGRIEPLSGIIGNGEVRKI